MHSLTIIKIIMSIIALAAKWKIVCTVSQLLIISSKIINHQQHYSLTIFNIIMILIALHIVAAKLEIVCTESHNY
jgi:hypothetical protein